MSDEPILAAIAALRSDMASRMDRLEAEITGMRTALMERMNRLQAWMDLTPAPPAIARRWRRFHTRHLPRRFPPT